MDETPLHLMTAWSLETVTITRSCGSLWVLTGQTLSRVEIRRLTLPFKKIPFLISPQFLLSWETAVFSLPIILGQIHLRSLGFFFFLVSFRCFLSKPNQTLLSVTSGLHLLLCFFFFKLKTLIMALVRSLEFSWFS